VWNVEGTIEFEDWYLALEDPELGRVTDAVDALERHGPNMKRPLVGEVQGSRYSNMKELRPLGTNIRVFFAFDPRRTAILLIGGDKTGRWRSFYDRMVPQVDRLYAEHLEELAKE